MPVFFYLILFLAVKLRGEESPEDPPIGNVVKATKKIYLKDFPDAFNPSIIKVDQGILFVFRYIQDVEFEPWISYIGVVLLDEHFEPISKPQLLDTRAKNHKIPSQSEDARIFAYRNKLYLIFNDNPDVYYPTLWDRRDMYYAELTYDGHNFSLADPIKLCHTEKYNGRLWQKNWSPFVWDDTLLITYTVNPHEILYPNLVKGQCYPCYETSAKIQWDYGELRGSGPAHLIDNEYLSFFHSGIYTTTEASFNSGMWHYYMGAYTFSPDPPFEMTKITTIPIVAEGFYTKSNCEKRVIMPGGFIVTDSSIYLAYGKDDSELWIATLDREELKKAMIPVR